MPPKYPKAVNGFCADPLYDRLSLSGKYCLPSCPPGYSVSEFNRCRKPKSQRAARKKYSRVLAKGGPCPADRPDLSKNGKYCLQACSPGYVRFAGTGRCRKSRGSSYGIARMMKRPYVRKAPRRRTPPKKKSVPLFAPINPVAPVRRMSF